MTGSSILPIPYAFKLIGILPGTLFTFLSACLVDYTSILLLRCAHRLKATTYEVWGGQAGREREHEHLERQGG